MIVVITRPLGGHAVSAVWGVALQAADGYCQCEGGCGSLHSKTGRRCDAGRHAPARLLVAPDDLTLSPEAAAALPAEQLRVWCQPCHSKAARLQREALEERVRRENPAPTLFDL